MLIVDHYSIDIEWEQQLRPFIKKVMVIDDVADRKHDCDLLLDQNYYLNMEHRYKNLVSNDCMQFLGPNYALLREEYLNVNPEELAKDGSIKNILIFYGGSDSTGETLKTLYAMENFVDKQIIFNVVISSINPFKEQIKLFCDKYENIKLHCNIDYMAKLMAQADIAIGAGGTASWERIYFKLPAIVTVLANNQLELTEALAHQGAIQSIGEKHNVKQSDIQHKLQALISNPQEVHKMMKKCSSIIDYSVVRGNKLVSQILELMK